MDLNLNGLQLDIPRSVKGFFSHFVHFPLTIFYCSMKISIT